MSLINRVLKDLDARNAPEVRDALHREVRPLPAPVERRFPWATALAFALLAAGGLAYLLLPVSGVPGPAEADAPVVAPLPPSVAMPSAVAPVVGPVVESLPANEPPAAVESSPTVDSPPVAEKSTVGVEPPSEPALPVAGAPVNTVASAASTVPSRPAPVTVKVPVPAATEPKAPAKTPASAPVARTPESAAFVPPPAPAMPAGVEKKAPTRSARDRADADFRQAVTLAGAGRGNEAVDLLLDILRDDGGHVSSRQLLVRLLVEQGRQTEAMALLAEGLVTQPGQVQWATALARLQVDRGELAAAATTLQASAGFAAANADYRGFSGFVAHRLGRQQEAAEHYRAALRVAPDEGRWWFGLGLALEAGGDAGAARDAFQRARAAGNLGAELAAIVDQKLR